MANPDRAYTRSVFVSVLALAVCATGTSLALAQPVDPHIGLATHAVPAPLGQELLRALRPRYEVTRLGNTPGRGLSAAVRARAEAADVTIVLLVSKRGAMFTLTYHLPVTGERLGVARIYMRGTRLSERAKNKLLDATERHVALVPVSHPEEDTTAPLAGDAHAGEGARTDDESRDELAADSEGETPESDDGPEPSARNVTAADETAADLDRRVELTVVAGVGTSAMNGDYSTNGLRSRLDAGLALAASLGARVVVTRPDAIGLQVEGRYMTSLERRVDELHAGGASQPMGLRTHRLEGGLGPRIPLTSGGWLLTPTLGYALRSVTPEVHFQLIPFYTLGGPYLRVELATPRLGSRVRLRLSPELQWLPQASTRVGGSRLGARFALGGQLALVVQISESVDVEAFVHESHAWANSPDMEVTDMERFVLANLAWRP